MPELGSYVLRIDLCIALLGAVAGVFAGLRGRPEWSRVAERSVGVVFVLTSLAMLALFYAFATGDYQLNYVAQHSARSMEIRYRLAALWGGQAGSLLLWLWMLTAYSAACIFAQRHASRRLMPWVACILLGNAIFFLVLLNFVTNPFEKLPPNEIPSDGAGLNPLLQHPIMMIHPLMLYTGFVGFAIPFAFGLAALITRDLSTHWLRATRRWTLFPWCFLSIGILLGGRWAYEVLGWGGYWAWDPVENASFMPWLPATAYLHSVMIQEKRDMLKTWNLALVGLTYSLCLFGTFLTRSGVVSSVHSFTAAGWFGFIFLAYVVVVAAVFFAFVIARRPLLRSAQKLESAVSREAGFVLNNWVFLAILVVVFWGTLFPVFSEWISGTKIQVGPAFFNAMNAPLALLLLFLTGVGPLLAWRKANLASLRKQFLVPLTCGIATALVLQLSLGSTLEFYPLLLWSLGAFVTATVLQEYTRAMRVRIMRRGESPGRAFATLLRKNQRRYGGYIVHIGVVLILAGIAGTAFNEEYLENVKPGETLKLRNAELQYLTAVPLPEQHYGGAEVRLALYEHGEPVAVLVPEKRMYWLEQQPASIPAIHSTLSRDLYVVLTALEPNGSATLKVHRNPLVNWIWIGGLIFVAGSCVVMWPQKVGEHGSRQA